MAALGGTGGAGLGATAQATAIRHADRAASRVTGGQERKESIIVLT